MLRVTRTQGLDRRFCRYTSNAHTSVSSELGLSESIIVIPNNGVCFELAGKNSFSETLFLV